MSSLPPAGPPRHQVLVIGCGSIGERHVRTFLATGRAAVIACDSRPAILDRMRGKYGVETVMDWRAALETHRVTAVVIATPAPLHIAMARHALDARRHVLIEKPLDITLEGCDALLRVRDAARVFAAVAYVLHCVPALRAAREFVRGGAFGAVRHVAVTTGHHFPSHRPAYREIYYRDHARGGGAIQDALTHNANAVEWFVGPTTRVMCDAAHQVLEGVEVEDTVNVLARNGPVLTSYALNQFQAATETRWDFHAELGSVRVELHTHRWATLRRGETEWTWHAALVENRDALFVAQANAFIDGCEGKPQALCTLEEGIQTLRFNLAALRSWRTVGAVEP